MVPALEIYFISSLKVCEMLEEEGWTCGCFFHTSDRHMLILFSCVLLYGCFNPPPLHLRWERLCSFTKH